MSKYQNHKVFVTSLKRMYRTYLYSLRTVMRRSVDLRLFFDARVIWLFVLSAKSKFFYLHCNRYLHYVSTAYTSTIKVHEYTRTPLTIIRVRSYTSILIVIFQEKLLISCNSGPGNILFLEFTTVAPKIEREGVLLFFVTVHDLLFYIQSTSSTWTVTSLI